MTTHTCFSVPHFVRLIKERRALHRHTWSASVYDNRERTRCLGVGSHAGYVRRHILELAPYKPILPLEVLSEQLGIEIEKIVKLDANENPYGPPEDVYEALATLQYPHIYPDPESRRLRKKLVGLLAPSSKCYLPTRAYSQTIAASPWRISWLDAEQTSSLIYYYASSWNQMML